MRHLSSLRALSLVVVTTLSAAAVPATFANGAVVLSMDSPGSSDPSPRIDGAAEGDAVGVLAREAADHERASGGSDPAVVLVEYMRTDVCPAVSVTTTGRPCTEELEGLAIPECEGLEALPPVWRRDRHSAADPWSPWQRISLWMCPWDALPALTAEEFQRLPLAAPVLNIQPDRPEVFVNMPTIAYTDPTVQTFTTTLLGYPIEVEATPARFTWDFGDGTRPLVTTSPGHPYPDHDVAHPYAHEGTFTITLTVEHTGRYRIAGTATTTADAGPITAEEHRSHLVDGNCLDNPHGPYCDD